MTYSICYEGMMPEIPSHISEIVLWVEPTLTAYRLEVRKAQYDYKALDWIEMRDLTSLCLVRKAWADLLQQKYPNVTVKIANGGLQRDIDSALEWVPLGETKRKIEVKD